MLPYFKYKLGRRSHSNLPQNNERGLASHSQSSQLTRSQAPPEITFSLPMPIIFSLDRALMTLRYNPNPDYLSVLINTLRVKTTAEFQGALEPQDIETLFNTLEHRVLAKIDTLIFHNMSNASLKALSVAMQTNRTIHALKFTYTNLSFYAYAIILTIAMKNRIKKERCLPISLTVSSFDDINVAALAKTIGGWVPIYFPHIQPPSMMRDFFPGYALFTWKNDSKDFTRFIASPDAQLEFTHLHESFLRVCHSDDLYLAENKHCFPSYTRPIYEYGMLKFTSAGLAVISLQEDIQGQMSRIVALRQLEVEKRLSYLGPDTLQIIAAYNPAAQIIFCKNEFISNIIRKLNRLHTEMADAMYNRRANRVK